MTNNGPREIPMMMKSFLMPMVIDESKNQSRRIGELWKRVKVGDRVWMREAWRLSSDDDAMADWKSETLYRADFTDPDPDWRWRPAVHMTREACRFVGEVVGVRQELLQDITPEDAIAEGVMGFHGQPFSPKRFWAAFAVSHEVGKTKCKAIEQFCWLMECMTPGIWAKNPVVTVIEWRKV